MSTKSALAEPLSRPASASRASIRLLGRLLGEVIREQHGQRAYEQIEDIRQQSVGEHRDGADASELRKRLARLKLPEMILLIRAFSIFSQLANIADDHLARRELQQTEADGLRELADRLGDKDVRSFLDQALISPVITAHPTEVRRKRCGPPQRQLGGDKVAPNVYRLGLTTLPAKTRSRADVD